MNPFEKIFNFALRYPRMWVLIFIGVFILMSWGFTKAHLELDIYDVQDPNFPTSVKLAEMREKFQDVNSLQVVFSPTAQSISSGDTCKIQDFFRNYSNSDARVQSWLSPWRLRKPHSESDKLWYFRFLRDPCGLEANRSIHEDLKKLETTPWGPILTDKKFQDFSIAVNFRDEEDDNGKKHFDPNVITELDNSLKKFIKDENLNLKYEISGQAAFRWHFKKILSKDALFNLAVMLLFLAFFRAFYGTWKAGFLYLFTLVYTTVVLYGLLCWLDMPIDLLTNNLFLMTAIAGVANFTFVCSAQEESDWKDSYRAILFPGFFTTFTTAIGFWSLMVSDINIIQRFGFAAGCGAMIERLSSFMVLPVFLEVFGFKGKWIDASKSWRPQWLAKSLYFKPNRKITLWLAGCLLLSFYAAFYLNFSDSPTKNFPESHPLRQAFHNLKEKRGWESSVYIVFNPRASRETQKTILDQVSKQPQVQFVESALEFEKFFTNELTPARGEMVLRELSATPVYGRYWQPDGTSRSMILLKSSSVDDLHILSEKIQSLCRSYCSPVGQNEVFREYSTKISATLAESFAVSLIIVLIILFCLAKHRGFNQYFALTVSVLWGPLVMIIFMWAFQIPINIVTSVFLAVIVGMTGDNAIQYMYAGENLSEGIDRRALASVLVTGLLAVASLTFVAQTLIPVRMLGLLFFLGFLASLFGDLWALKGLLSLSDKKN